LAGDSESGPLLGWSGWTQVDRVLALIDLIEDRLAAGKPDRRSLIPLIAALQEVLEWVDDNDTDLCCTDVGDRARLDGWMDRLGITERDLETWRPASPKRGRPRKQPAIDHGEGS
jgi:hypothetical protein